MDFPREVYAIQHNVTNRIYIGSSIHPRERYMNHMCRLKQGTHSVEDMQDDFNKYGDDFSFYILDTIHDYDERGKEYIYMDKYHSDIRGIGYNYKDNIKARSKYYISNKSGEPEPYKKGYVDEIIKLLAKCNDISMLDLVVQLLSKTIDSEQHEQKGA